MVAHLNTIPKFEETQSISYLLFYLPFESRVQYMKLGPLNSGLMLVMKRSRANTASATASHLLEQLYQWCQKQSMVMLVDKLKSLHFSGANRGFSPD